MALTRDDLYQQVWAEPMTKVATRHRVSSSFLARICSSMNVPRPERGYWVKVEYGQRPSVPPLPPARPGELLEWLRPGEDSILPPTAVTPPPSGVQNISKPVRLPRPPKQHALLDGIHELLAQAGESHFQYLRPMKRKMIDIMVSRGTFERAIDAANTLFLALDRNGHRVCLAPHSDKFRRAALDEREKGGRQDRYYRNWEPDRPTITYLGEIPIALTLFETSEYVPVRTVEGKPVRVADAPIPRRSDYDWTRNEDMPSGRLALRATTMNQVWEQTWRESGRLKLKAMASDIVAHLETAAPTIADMLAEAARLAEIEMRKWQEQHEQWRREEAEKRRIANIQASRENLLAAIKSWNFVHGVVAFFEDVERRVADLPEADRAEVHSRLAAARQLIGPLDALESLRAWKPPEP